MKTWPTDDKIDEIVGGIVTGYAACGLDPLQLKLKDVLVNFNKFGYTGNLLVSGVFKQTFYYYIEE